MSRTVQVAVEEIVKETDKAIGVILDFRDYEITWIPLSQVHAIHRGAFPSLEVTEWIARQKGLMS